MPLLVLKSLNMKTKAQWQLLVLATFLLAWFTAAAPSRAQLERRGCSYLAPAYMQQISEMNPDTVYPNNPTNFFVEQVYSPGGMLANPTLPF